MIAKEVVNALKLLATEERRKVNEWFFKTGKGEYGYGDIFLGVTVPNIRRIAKKFSQEIPLQEITKLIQSPIHEVRLCALIILVNKYNKGQPEKIYRYYLKHLNSINNWDLVDTSAPHIEFNQTLKIANLLIYDDHDLIHKAVGWMLREVYKRDADLIKRFLRQNYAQIPRTTLRYAIERMDKEERLSYLKGNFDVSH